MPPVVAFDGHAADHMRRQRENIKYRYMPIAVKVKDSLSAVSSAFDLKSSCLPQQCWEGCRRSPRSLSSTDSKSAHEGRFTKLRILVVRSCKFVHATKDKMRETQERFLRN
jgi:hypothetical protein